MSGWIKIHRAIQQHWIAQDMEKFGWWIDLLLLASYEDNKTFLGNRIKEIKRGQFIASLRFLAERWKTSKDRVSSFLKLLVQDNMITKESDNHETLITICNYESYQEISNVSETPSRHHQDAIKTPSRQTKEIQEIKEHINKHTNSACAREGIVSWDAVREQGYFDTFKGQGSAIPFSKRVGKTPQEVMQLAEIYMATRQLKDKGHKDYNEFINLFLWHVENNKITIPTQPKAEKKVISGKDVLNVYG